MNTNEIDSKIHQLLMMLFDLNTNKGAVPKRQFKKIIAKWQLGTIGHKAVGTQVDENFAASSIEEKINTIKGLVVYLSHNIEPILVHLLYVDVRRVCMVDGQIDHSEELALNEIEKILAPYIKINKQQGFYNIADYIFTPKHNLVALGYLFWAAVVIDGHIDENEKDKVIENLGAWRDTNARSLFSALKLARIINNSHEIFKYKSEIFVNTNFKKSIQNCIEFLQKNEPEVRLKLMRDQIVKILKADGHIHENEKWLYEELNKNWEC